LLSYNAAKIPLSSAYNYLVIDDRRIENIAIFIELKFTPQRIWCIPEHLKHQEVLSEIEAEFLAYQKIYTLKAEASKQDISITRQ